MPPPASANSSNPAHRSKKRRWTREMIDAHLKIIGDIEPLLPPTLPPSPPASRSASPATGFKRKLDSSSDPDAHKRPRTNLSSERGRQPPPPPQTLHSTPQPQPQPPPPSAPPTRQQAPPPSHFASRSEPCEDGEVREDPAVPPLSISRGGPTINVPIRRPKKGKPSQRHHDTLHDKYHHAGRMLKYSGDARFFSTYPPTHRDYRPLHDPPPPGSPYHKYGGIIARLELIDALVCFAYSIWNRDYARRSCNKETWHTIKEFLVWCKQKWTAEEGISDAERAFLGLIMMIEGFIHSRQIYYTVKGHLEGEVDKAHESLAKKVAAAASTAIEGDPVSAASFGIPNGKAPPMLPSPSSQNSTPVNREDGTPNASTTATRPTHPPSRRTPYTGPVPAAYVPTHLLQGSSPIPAHVMTAMGAATEPISPILMNNVHETIHQFTAAAYCVQTWQQSLNLPVLRRCFPNTWARMMYSNLTPYEEHEPDFEDEEGELFWPDQCITGDGIGWVCLMGKAMITEFGKAYGYKGIEGVVPKPKPQAPPEGAPGSSSAGSSSHPQSYPRTNSGQSASGWPSTSSGAPR